MHAAASGSLPLPASSSSRPPHAPLSRHGQLTNASQGQGLGPRLRRLHARIGKAHHQAEGMVFSRALLNGAATPQQLRSLLDALLPGYILLEQRAPAAAAALGGRLPWPDLVRSASLRHDLTALGEAGLPTTAPSAASGVWCSRLIELAQQSPHRLMAHVYVRYGGDLSGGQQLGQQANAILARHGLPALRFWSFMQPVAALKDALHGGIEALRLSAEQEEELLAEAETAFLLTQRLLAELAANA